jgi:glycosyltransferase involved in cell wall biosynthesis
VRILVVNWLDLDNPQAGGAEIHLHEVFGRLAARGHDVTVLASGWKGGAPRTTADGMEIHRTGGRYTFLLRARSYYRRHWAADGFDVIVEDLNKVPLFTPLWGSTPVVPLVHHLFGWTAFREASPPMALATVALEAPAPKLFHGLPAVAVSESTKADLVRRGFRPGDVSVIPNGVDLIRYTPDGRGRFPVPTLLYLGRLKRYKRVDLIIRAVARLADRGIDVELRIGGKGDHRSKLEELVTRLGIGDRVHFLGFVSEEEKVELMRRAWVHLLTSPKEGWGIVNLEAAACGTPTIASDAPGLRDSVRHGETGFLVPHGDVDALASSIAEVVGNPALRDRLGAGAEQFAAGFTWDAAATAMEARLRSAVDQGGSIGWPTPRG